MRIGRSAGYMFKKILTYGGYVLKPKTMKKACLRSSLHAVSFHFGLLEVSFLLLVTCDLKWLTFSENQFGHVF